MTRQELKDLSADNIKNSPPSNITAAGLRQLNTELIDSTATMLNDNTFTGVNTFNGAVICNADLYTGYVIGIAASATVDLTAVTGNSVFIGGYDTITSFGTAQGGEIRFLKFYDACQLANNSNISVPTGQLINVEAGDSCTVIGKDDGTWVVVNYLRNSGLPLAASEVLSWTVNSAAPTLTESDPPYKLGYRWVSQESGVRRKEWISDYAQTYSAVWNPMAGSFGEWGDGKDLEINALILRGGAYASIRKKNLRYKRVSNLVTIDGTFDLANLSGSDGHIEFDFDFNNQGLNFIKESFLYVGTLKVGNSQLDVDEYSVYNEGTQKLWYEVTNVLSNDSAVLKFKATIFLQN